MDGGHLWRGIAEWAVDLGFASTPESRHADRELCPYGAKGAEARVVYANSWGAIPNIRDIDPLKQLAPLEVGGVIVGMRGARRDGDCGTRSFTFSRQPDKRSGQHFGSSQMKTGPRACEVARL